MVSENYKIFSYRNLEKLPINNFTIYGERHSGTNYLEKIVKRRFKLKPVWNYGWKHFFGFCEWQSLNSANNTLFIGIVRNVYDWIGGMQKTPHHVPTKNRNIEHLISCEWMSIIKGGRENVLDRNYWTNQRYKDIFSLRSTKIKFLYHFMPFLVDNYLLITYEDLLEHNVDIVKFISTYYNLDGETRQTNTLCPKPKQCYELPCSIIEKINVETDWSTENLIGYKKNYRFNFLKTQGIDRR
jgi:hypothetical protein